jgi:cold shock CspA family protein/transcriptional regulator with XRE-family HTH domain
MSRDDHIEMTAPPPEEVLQDATSLARFQESLDLAEGARLVRQMRANAHRVDGGVGISQTMLAERIGVTQARISQIERTAGRDGPSFVLLKRIARACNLVWPATLLESETDGVGRSEHARKSDVGVHSEERPLWRPTEAVPDEAEHHLESQPVSRTPGGTLRGVVKWFDGRTGKGALRLTGISGDVMLDPVALSRSGIKHLYKDQEVEATVQEKSGRVNLLSLSLPVRSAESSFDIMAGDIMAGEITGTLRRSSREVQLELKRGGIRQSAPSPEVKQGPGGGGRIKANRRSIP